MSTAEHQYSN